MLQHAEDQLFEYDQAALQLSARPSAVHESTLSSHTDSPCYPVSLVPLQTLCGDFSPHTAQDTFDPSENMAVSAHAIRSRLGECM